MVILSLEDDVKVFEELITTSGTLSKHERPMLIQL